MPSSVDLRCVLKHFERVFTLASSVVCDDDVEVVVRAGRVVVYKVIMFDFRAKILLRIMLKKVISASPLSVALLI